MFTHETAAALNQFYSAGTIAKIQSMTFQNHAAIDGFNPLTPPSFESVISPKISQNGTNQPDIKTEMVQMNLLPNFPEAKEPSTTCITPPLEGTPPKSPKNLEDTENSYYEKNGEDHLRRLQMAFEKNGMLPESPKENDNRDSGEDDIKSDYDMDEIDENGLRIPRVNSHGKVKTFKCKQCDFVAVTKLDFWEHSRAHIKADKLLTCPKCPFVTEYKHHLEYHLRNHFGSKPFKCDKCNYSCVNKSMLNSHLKSHSNVYQYRCSDCTYATKYCHSLKLHLRKYKHNPAMVLNPDGSPNPLPIIDVYGTRRGPKQKSLLKEDLQIQSPPHPTLPQHSIFNPFMVPNPQHPVQLPFPWLGFPGPLGNPLLTSHSNNNIDQRHLVSPNGSNGSSSSDHYENDNEIHDSPATNVESDIERNVTHSTPDSAVLDLSKPEVDLPISVPQIPAQTPLSVPLVSKNRRKGRAFKLERIPINQEFSEDEDLEEKQYKTVKNNEDEENKLNDSKKSDIYNCHYCDIAFRDIVMYTMHMGYHGYKDPFTCNMCGEQSGDKVSFFLHIARTSHS